MNIATLWNLKCASPQWLQIQNSPDPGPRNDILYVTDCIKGEAYAVRRSGLGGCTGWKEIVDILGNVRFLIRGLLLVLPAVSCPIPSTLVSYEQLKHLHGDLLTQELLPVLPELLYTRILDTAMWRVKPVYSLIAGEGGRGGCISNTPLSQLLQNKLQRHMHTRAHTHAHVFSTGCTQSKRVKKASWSLQVDFSVHIDISRSWLRLDGWRNSPAIHPQRENESLLAAFSFYILYISVSSVQISAFVADKPSNIRLKSTKQNIFGCSIYLIYPQLPHFVPTVV